MHTSTHHSATEEDMNLVEHWLKFSPKRWIAGALSGALAGAVMAAFGGILARHYGYEVTFPVKIAALPWLGNEATAYGNTGPGFLVGLLAHEALAALSGAVFSHFIFARRFRSLLALGLVWGSFSWVFLNNLYSTAFPSIIYITHEWSGLAFFANLVFGASLTSLAVFDKMLGGTDH